MNAFDPQQKPERQAAAEQSGSAVNDEALEKYLKGDPKLSENEQDRSSKNSGQMTRTKPL